MVSLATLPAETFNSTSTGFYRLQEPGYEITATSTSVLPSLVQSDTSGVEFEVFLGITRTNNLKFRHPLLVHILSEEDYFIAELQEFKVFAVGDSYNQAVQELKVQLDEWWEVIENEPNLAEDIERAKRNFHSLIS